MHNEMSRWSLIALSIFLLVVSPPIPAQQDPSLVKVEELDTVDAALEPLGQPEITQSILNSPPVNQVRADVIRAAEEERLASQREHSRLLFVRQGEEYCVVGIWDSRTGDSTELSRISSCPSMVFASKDVESVFVVGRRIIQTVTIDSPADKSNVDLPNLDYRVWIEQMSVRPDRNPDYLPHTPQMTPTGIGRFEDGSLGMIASLGMPAYDMYQYLFRHVNGQWSFEDERSCDRRDGCGNPFDALAYITSDAWSWPEYRMVRHPNISLNPFFSGEPIELVDHQNESDQGVMYHRKFEIEGVSSLLRAYTFPSGDSGATITSGVELTVGNRTRVLSRRQCLTSIVGRFILINEFFGSRFEVTDIGTGETMINNLTTAIWLD